MCRDAVDFADADHMLVLVVVIVSGDTRESKLRCNPSTGLDDCYHARSGMASRAIALRAVVSNSQARLL